MHIHCPKVCGKGNSLEWEQEKKSDYSRMAELITGFFLIFAINSTLKAFAFHGNNFFVQWQYYFAEEALIKLDAGNTQHSWFKLYYGDMQNAIYADYTPLHSGWISGLATGGSDYRGEKVASSLKSLDCCVGKTCCTSRPIFSRGYVFHSRRV